MHECNTHIYVLLFYGLQCRSITRSPTTGPRSYPSRSIGNASANCLVSLDLLMLAQGVASLTTGVPPRVPTQCGSSSPKHDDVRAHVLHLEPHASASPGWSDMHPSLACTHALAWPCIGRGIHLALALNIHGKCRSESLQLARSGGRLR
jgi:hypothetical protein